MKIQAIAVIRWVVAVENLWSNAMATLTVNQTKNYVGTILPTGIDLIDFTNVFSAATATFSSTQADGAPIQLDTAIDGSSNANHIVIGGGSIDVSQWSFSNWSLTFDSVTLNGSDLEDTLLGSIHRDTLNGLQGNDVLTGGNGADTLNGGAGNDVIAYTASSQLTTGEDINGNSGSKDRIRLDGGITYDFRTASVASIEMLEFNDVAVARFDGNTVGAGAINLVKGHGDLDWLELYGNSIDLTGVSFTNWSDGSDILRLTAEPGVASTLIGSGQADIIAGSSVADTLSGRTSNDDLYGFGGADTMTGGSGDDTFFYSAGANIVTGENVSGGSGLDTIQLQSNTGSYLFGIMTITGVEVLRFSNLGSTVSIDGDQIGSGGIVSVVGAGGDDQLVVHGSTDLSGVTLSTWSFDDSVFIFGGNQTDDIIVGSSDADEIDGDGGDDTIEGGAGFDSLIGGAGDDTVSYAGSALAVNVNLQTNMVSGGDAAGDIISSFVNVIGGQGDDTLTGSDLANSIAGGAGDDVIIGGLGADNLQGGGGADTFIYQSGDELDGIETINGGGGDEDTITFVVNVDNSFTFIDANVTGIERLVFTANELVGFKAGVLGSGPGQIDTVVGSANNNALTIIGPNTDLSGVTFSNWLGVFGGDVVRIIGDFDDETIIGSDVTDEIIGLSGSDTIDGGGSADILLGSLGQDFLTGGAGADIFVYEAVNDSATGGSRDRILDFNQGTDTIRLSDMDAKTGGGDNAFVFIAELDFSDGQAGRLRYFHNIAGNTIIEGEVNGDGIADFSIQINGQVNLAGADFEL